jgi:hypothetical protein
LRKATQAQMGLKRKTPGGFACLGHAFTGGSFLCLERSEVLRLRSRRALSPSDKSNLRPPHPPRNQKSYASQRQNPPPSPQWGGWGVF